MAVLEVDGVHRTFAGRSPVLALRGVSLSAEAGEIVGLLGVNGAGKTTLVKIVCTLLLPTSGTARVCGYDVVNRARDARAHLGVVFGGDRGLYGRLSAVDNLMFFGGLAGVRRNLRARALEALEQVGLGERAHSKVETFSRGMRQRLHLAAGLLHAPPLLLLDEPTVGLDTVEAERIRESIAALARDGVTILLTSHYPVDIDQLAQRVVVLQDGRASHDIGIEAFRRLAGFVAQVRVRGSGAAPELDRLHAVADEVEVSHDEGGWTLAYRLREWDMSSLSAISTATAGLAVTDVAVVPVGLDVVLRSLFQKT
jgi:ABC-2 type transport system ATP-binding protein